MSINIRHILATIFSMAARGPKTIGIQVSSIEATDSSLHRY